MKLTTTCLSPAGVSIWLRIVPLVLLSQIIVFGIYSWNVEGKELERPDSVTVILTVAGEIQTEDPWTEGPQTVNEWAKPLYRIWFDMNGNPSDGGYSNAMGPKQAELWLDTGNLCFMWFGQDKQHSTGDDVLCCPLNKTGKSTWKDRGIEASITQNRKSLQATIPLAMLGNPKSMEVSFMVSPWTSSASDNLGKGANHRPAWIVIKDTWRPGTYSSDDESGDNFWPHLTPDKCANFDLIKGEVIIF